MFYVAGPVVLKAWLIDIFFSVSTTVKFKKERNKTDTG